jgi:hypothetical protein
MQDESKRHRYVPSPAMVVACIALTVALAGTSYAITLPRNSVGKAQLKQNAVVSAKVQDRSLQKRDLKAGVIPAGLKAYAYLYYDGTCHVTPGRSLNVSGCTMNGTSMVATTTVDISHSWPLCVQSSNGGHPTRPESCITRTLTAHSFEVTEHYYPLSDTDMDGEINGYGSPLTFPGGPTTGMFVFVP